MSGLLVARARRLPSMTGALLLAAIAMGVTPAAHAMVQTDDGGVVPFYARITTIGEPDQIFHDTHLAVVPFYRPPHCVPGGFDLLTFFDFPEPGGPGAFACDPPTTDGFNIWENGFGIDPAPTLSVTHGLGAVPVWFVDWPALEIAVADGVLLMDELRGLPRVEGFATSFQQVLRPHGTNDVPMASFVARGFLTDGRSFSARGIFVEGVVIQTRISIY